jgi:hypothetical protein
MLILCVTEGLAPEVALQRIAKIQFIIWMDINTATICYPRSQRRSFASASAIGYVGEKYIEEINGENVTIILMRRRRGKKRRQQDQNALSMGA